MGPGHPGKGGAWEWEVNESEAELRGQGEPCADLSSLSNACINIPEPIWKTDDCNKSNRFISDHSVSQHSLDLAQCYLSNSRSSSAERKSLAGQVK